MNPCYHVIRIRVGNDFRKTLRDLNLVMTPGTICDKHKIMIRRRSLLPRNHMVRDKFDHALFCLYRLVGLENERPGSVSRFIKLPRWEIVREGIISSPKSLGGGCEDIPMVTRGVRMISKGGREKGKNGWMKGRGHSCPTQRPRPQWPTSTWWRLPWSHPDPLICPDPSIGVILFYFLSVPLLWTAFWMIWRKKNWQT